MLIFVKKITWFQVQINERIIEVTMVRKDPTFKLNIGTRESIKKIVVNGDSKSWVAELQRPGFVYTSLSAERNRVDYDGDGLDVSGASELSLNLTVLEW